MSEFVTIRQVAKAMGWTYHLTRRKLKENPDTARLMHKLDYSVMYDRKVLEVLRASK